MSGANVSASGGAIMLRADILPSDVNLPVAIVYDADGTVTNALLAKVPVTQVPASAMRPMVG